jgi:hypothetical protein
MTDTETKIAKLLAYLDQAFPAFVPTPQLAAIWQDALDIYHEPALLAAAQKIARGDMGFVVKPSTALVADAIDGRLVRVPIARTDAFGGVYPQNIIGWRTIRIPPGTNAPDYLSEIQARQLGAAPFERIEAQPTPPQLEE